MSTKPWEHAKHAGAGDDPLAARFVSSLEEDWRLYRHDVAGSLAHARLLEQVGLVSEAEREAIEAGLHQIEREIDAEGRAWPGFRVELEDVHMCIEAALIEKAGDAGRKLHTGRSRNDQVATDLKLWAAEAREVLEHHLDALLEALVDLADRQGELVMPAYTHLQRAQPITLAGELAAWVTALERGRARLAALAELHRDCPLGAGAIAGSTLPLDRAATGAALDLGPPSPSSIEATSSRDVAIDMAYGLAMVAMWLSRWAEQWILYMSDEFGFLQLGEAHTTGSSMMPQKRNPDMLELIRGRSGEAYGRLTALLTLCKGLTVGYNRDLQEDKRHIFPAFDSVRDSLAMAARIVAGARFDAGRVGERLERGFLDATGLAEYLVTRGTPFRTAHQHVGALVRTCQEKGVDRLASLSVAEMNEVAGGAIGDDVYGWLGAENLVRRYQTTGSAGVSGPRETLATCRKRLAERRAGRDHAGSS